MELFCPFSKNTGTDTAVVEYLITDDGTGCGIHDEPDVSFDSFHFQNDSGIFKTGNRFSCDGRRGVFSLYLL